MKVIHLHAFGKGLYNKAFYGFKSNDCTGIKGMV